jgi:hypothetical protein
VVGSLGTHTCSLSLSRFWNFWAEFLCVLCLMLNIEHCTLVSAVQCGCWFALSCLLVGIPFCTCPKRKQRKKKSMTKKPSTRASNHWIKVKTGGHGATKTSSESAFRIIVWPQPHRQGPVSLPWAETSVNVNARGDAMLVFANSLSVQWIAYRCTLCPNDVQVLMKRPSGYERSLSDEIVCECVMWSV